MTARQEIRLCGLATVFAAGLWGFTEIPGIAQDSYAPLQLSFTALAFMIFTYSFIGIHRVQAEQGGLISFIGAMLASVSHIVWAGECMIEIILEAQDSSVVLELAAGKVIYLSGTVLYIVSFVVLGIAVIRARVFPRWTGYVLIFVNVAYLAIPFIKHPYGIINILNLLICVTLAVMGWIMWSGKYEVGIS